MSVGQFREEGYLPEAMVNYLAFLGWNPKDDREIFSLEQLAEEFSVEAMSKTPSVFDYKRIHFLSGEWMQRIDRDRVAVLCIDYLIDQGFLTADEAREKKDWLGRIITEVTGRLKIISDVAEYTDFFFKDEFDYDEKGAGKFFKDGETASMLEDMAGILPALEPFDTENIESAVRKYMEEKELGAKKVIHPLRLALTGKTIGPGLFETITLLGPERAGQRIRRAVEFIKSGE